MKILLGSSRVALKLLLKILLQCSLPVDGSSAGRGGSAQAPRAAGLGRAALPRVAALPRGRTGCAAAAPGKTPTPRLRMSLGGGIGHGRGVCSRVGSSPGGGFRGEARRDARTAERRSQGYSASRILSLSLLNFYFFCFIWSISCFFTLIF